MKLTNIFSRLLAIFGFLIMFSISGWGAITSCPGNTISSLNGATSSATNSVSGTIPGNTTYYYTFTPNASGTIQVNSHVGGYTNQLFIKSGCSTNLWSDTSDSNDKSSPAVNVSAGQQIVIALARTYNSSQSYSLDFTFTAIAPPVISAATRSVDENSPAGTYVGTPITATNSPTSFAITGGTGQSLFSIDSSGQITVKTGAVLNYEATPSYTLTVTATNGTGTSNPAATVTINLNNILPPTVNSSSFTVPSGSGAGTIIGTVTTGGGPATSFSINDATFAISSTGVITVASNGKMTPVGKVFTPTVTASSVEGSGSNQMTITVVQALATPNVGDRTFSLRSANNVNGGVVTIGNTVLCVTNSSGACIDYPVNSQNTLTNSGLDLHYVDIDSNSSTFNSSQAKLSLPSTATVVWAGLYTQGYVDDQGTTTNLANYQTELTAPVYLTIPSVGMVKLFPQVLDMLANSTNGYTYSTYNEVTALEGLPATSVNGWITGANIKSQTGTDSTGLGHYGAWTLVVVYSDPNETLKNISVFDGYKKISSAGDSTVTITPSGFLTPSAGKVASTLSLFAGEGDANIAGDTLKVNTTFLNNTNAFYSGITGVTTNPSFTNNEGIDIQNYTIGVDGNNSHPQIIGNGATSANIIFSTSQDTYFPSMIAFSTDIYSPFISITKSANTNGTLVAGQAITYTANIKNTGTEVASNIVVYDDFDSNTLYKTDGTITDPIVTLGNLLDQNTTQIQNSIVCQYGSSNTNCKSSCSVTLSPFKVSCSIPSLSIGGTALIQFTTNLSSAPDTKNQNVKVQNQMTSTFYNAVTGALQPQSSSNVANAGTYSNLVLGTIDVWDTTILSSTPPPISSRRLYTQIVSPTQATTLTIGSMDTASNATYQASTPLGWRVVDNSLACSATSDNNITGWNDVNLTATNPTTIQFTPSQAYKNLKIQFASKTNGAYDSTSRQCSTDNFAIRPSDLLLDTNSTTANLIGGKAYTLTATARPTPYTNNYTQTIDNSADKNISTPLILPAGCTLPNLTFAYVAPLPLPAIFTAGVLTTTFKYPDIGDLNVSVNDAGWTSVDSTEGDCIAGSASNTITSGKVGCLVQGSKILTFVPKQFNSTLSIANHSTGFTYISTDGNTTNGNMSAPLTLITTAVLNDDTTATNYTKKCFARDINSTISLSNDQNLSWGTSKTRVKFFDDSNVTSKFLSQTNNNATFSTSDGNFTSGTANITFKVNFDRNVSISDNPFNIAKNDFNITSIVDQNGTTGNDFNRTTNINATFVYGRTHAPRYRFTSATGDAKIFYEMYCGADGNKTILQQFNSPLKGDSDSAGWYLNENHNTSSDGNISLVAEKNGNGSTIPNTTASASAGGGFSTTTLNYNSSKGFPYKTTIQDTTSSWLIYDPYNPAATTNEFEVEFYKTGIWTGKITNTTTVDSVAAPVTSKRILW